MVDIASAPIPRTMLYGKGFVNKLDLLKRSSHWTHAELQNYQEERMRDIIANAYRTVPYYHELLKSNGKRPEDIASIRDLKKLPVLSKDTVRNKKEQLISADFKKYGAGDSQTSGSTTGKPLRFMLDQENRELGMAAIWRHIFWGGVSDPNARVASFGGDFASDVHSPDLWRWDVMFKELTFNSYNINSKNIGAVVEKLNSYKPAVLRAYPHVLYIVALEMQRSKVRLANAPKVIQTHSEHLWPNMRGLIEEVMGTKIVDWYGQAEFLVTAGQCECGHYHQTMESAIMDTIEDEWGMERLVGTHLWNHSMPLINYEIGDIITGRGDGCPCGRHHTYFSSVEGRTSDIIITKEGRALSGATVESYYDKKIMPSIPTLEYLKLVQESKDHFLIEAYKGDGGLSDGEAEFLVASYDALLGPDAAIRIKQLDAPPATKKWKSCESKLAPGTIMKAIEGNM